MRRFIFALAFLLALPAFAGYEHHGKPAPEWLKRWALGFDATWNGSVGGAFAGQYQFKESRIILEGAIGYERSQDVSGTTPFRVGCRTFTVPWSQSGEGGKVYRFGFRIPLD